MLTRALVVLAAGLQALQTMIRSIERRIIAQQRSKQAPQEHPWDIGIVGATAIAATVPDPKVFRWGRDFAAWIGIVPRQDFDWRQTEARADLETRRPSIRDAFWWSEPIRFATPTLDTERSAGLRDRLIDWAQVMPPPGPTGASLKRTS